MNKDDPALKLAQAALDATGAESDALDKAFDELKPSTTEIARAYAVCLTRTPFRATEGTRLMLNARLQVALMQEHVAAQERMASVINWLTYAFVFLTVGFGTFEIWRR